MLSRLNQLRIALTLPFFSHTKLDPNQFRTNMSSSTTQSEIATFAAGCFWGVEHIFLKHYPPSQNKGILKTSVGYTGGHVKNPDYGSVCSGTTGHAEALRIEFDPAIVTYEELVEFFYRTHEPTTLNRQGYDSGSQYRSAIFTHSPAQYEKALSVTAEIQKKHFDALPGVKGREETRKIVTQIVEAGEWYDAEDSHQLYLFENPNGYQCSTHVLHW
jgi:peptide-methionine (S)-S-oxide reductase